MTDVVEDVEDRVLRDVLAEQLRRHVEVAAASEDQLPTVRRVGELLCRSFRRGGILYCFGNGGSAADAQHLVGEIIGRYRSERRPYGAVALSVDPTVTTCIANDYGFEEVFARQVQGLVRPGDVVAAFTTSGRSPNVVTALARARLAGATTVLFAGGDGGPATTHADHRLLVPSNDTPRIQEVHTFWLHALAEVVDACVDDLAT